MSMCVSITSKMPHIDKIWIYAFFFKLLARVMRDIKICMLPKLHIAKCYLMKILGKKNIYEEVFVFPTVILFMDTWHEIFVFEIERLKIKTSVWENTKFFFVLTHWHYFYLLTLLPFSVAPFLSKIVFFNYLKFRFTLWTFSSIFLNNAFYVF